MPGTPQIHHQCNRTTAHDAVVSGTDPWEARPTPIVSLAPAAPGPAREDKDEHCGASPAIPPTCRWKKKLHDTTEGIRRGVALADSKALSDAGDVLVGIDPRIFEPSAPRLTANMTVATSKLQNLEISGATARVIWQTLLRPQQQCLNASIARDWSGGPRDRSGNS